MGIKLHLVSVIIPCYNQAQYLPDAVASIQVQTYVNWECIIVNDGSTDNTAAIAEKLAQTDTRIQVIHQTNKGLSGARNTGLSVAMGEMVQFLDADDMLEQDKLRTHVEFLHSTPDMGIVFGDARYFTTENPELREYGVNINKSWIPEVWQARGHLIEKFLKGNLFPVNCPLVRRSVFNAVGQWNVDLEAHEDWEFWLRCAIANIKIAFYNCPDSLALIRMHPESMSNDKSRMHRTIVKMRIAIGNTLKEPALRLINYENGLFLLKSTNPPDIINQLFKLSRANLSPKIVFITLRFFFLEHLILSKKLINAYKNSMPWPIQKALLKIFGLS